MKILLKINSGFIAPQLPDTQELFENQETVVINDDLFFFADYVGSKQLVSDYDVDSYLADIEAAKPAPILPPQVVELTNVNVTGEHVTLGNGGIWWLPKNSEFTLTANAELPDAEMMIIVERVINGSTVVDDLRIKAAITGGVITVNGLFAMSGNYIVTAERLNQGLEIIDAPFRLAFDKVEFDAHV